jgi:S-methylmethionine-dependent homocysteine/selenocysteine methylase
MEKARAACAARKNVGDGERLIGGKCNLTAADILETTTAIKKFERQKTTHQLCMNVSLPH